MKPPIASVIRRTNVTERSTDDLTARLGYQR